MYLNGFFMFVRLPAPKNYSFVRDCFCVSGIIHAEIPQISIRNYAEIIDTFHFLKHASILYF